MNKIYLIVYGSLMRGFGLSHYLREFKFIKSVEVQGFKMWDNGFFPMIKRGKGKIKEELYEVDFFDWILKKPILDFIECSYKREVIEVEGKQCFIYVWKGGTESLSFIPSGDFRDLKGGLSE